MQVATWIFLFMLFLPVALRGQHSPADSCKATHLEISYKCSVGMTVLDYVRQINMDTSRFRTIEEPPGVLKGIAITVGDSCIVRIYTGGPMLTDSLGDKRFSRKSDFILIAKKKIKGISWVVYKGDTILRRGSAGDVVWYWGDR